MQLLSIFVCVSARPKEMCTGAHSSALIRLLQKFGCSKSTLNPQGFMVFFTEALHPLKSTIDQSRAGRITLKTFSSEGSSCWRNWF